VGSGFDALRGELCWGRMEIAVIIAVIFASMDRSWKQRLAGAALGIVAIVGIFNPLRIAASILSGSEFVHDVLFRLTLLLAIVGWYAFWYLYLTRRARKGGCWQ